MKNRKLMSGKDEKKFEKLLRTLKKSKNVLIDDKLRQFLIEDERLNQCLPSCAGNPPPLFYLLSFANGLKFMRLNTDILGSCSAATINYVHHDGNTVMSGLIQSVLVRSTQTDVIEAILSNIDAEIFNRSHEAGSSIAIRMLNARPRFVLRHYEQLERLISPESLNAALLELVTCDEGLELLLASARLRAMIDADTLNRVVEGCSPAEELIADERGREILKIDPALRVKLGEDPINIYLQTLVTEGLDLLHAAPDMISKITSSKLGFFNGVRTPGYELLMREEGRALLNASPELSSKIPEDLVNRIGYTDFREHLFDIRHPFRSAQFVKKIVVFDIMNSEKGREFLETNAIIRRKIRPEALHAKFQYGENKGRCGADLLKLPEYRNLRTLFMQDYVEKIMDVMIENMMLVVKAGNKLKLLGLHQMQNSVSVSKTANQFKLWGLRDMQKTESVSQWVEANREQSIRP